SKPLRVTDVRVPRCAIRCILGAVAACLLRKHGNSAVEKLMKLDQRVLVGTLSYSGPETGSHFWYPFSSGAERMDGGWKVRKKASWTRCRPHSPVSRTALDVAGKNLLRPRT